MRKKLTKAVLIMDMPESCAKCAFFGITIDDEPTCICPIDVYKRISANVMTEKPDWCPLQPITEKNEGCYLITNEEVKIK